MALPCRMHQLLNAITVHAGQDDEQRVTAGIVLPGAYRLTYGGHLHYRCRTYCGTSIFQSIEYAR